MAGWQDIDDELNAWGDAGLTPRFWWRDDDAIQVTPALDRLIDIANKFDVPLVVAVIPAAVQSNLPQRLNREPAVGVIQHGFAHENHALQEAKSSEYPDTRSIKEMSAEIVDGWSRLSSFDHLEKAFVPPWNRISENLSIELTEQGYSGISTYGARKTSVPFHVNTHVDIIDWRGHRGFAGQDRVLDQTLKHLQNKRLRMCDADEPTGLLTHHLDHDEDCWNYLEIFLDWTRNRHAIEWLSARQLFGRRETEAPYD